MRQLDLKDHFFLNLFTSVLGGGGFRQSVLSGRVRYSPGLSQFGSVALHPLKFAGHSRCHGLAVKYGLADTEF